MFLFIRYNQVLNEYAEPIIREPFHFIYKIYEIQVNIGCDLHASSVVCPTDVVHVLMHVGSCGGHN